LVAEKALFCKDRKPHFMAFPPCLAPPERLREGGGGNGKGGIEEGGVYD